MDQAEYHCTLYVNTCRELAPPPRNCVVVLVVRVDVFLVTGVVVLVVVFVLVGSLAGRCDHKSKTEYERFAVNINCCSVQQ